MKISTEKIVIGVGSLLGAAFVSAIWYLKHKRRVTKHNIKQMLPELFRPMVHMKDREYVQLTIANIINAGPDKLQVIADFDRTLTRYEMDGVEVATCHQALDASELMPDWFHARAAEMRDKYYPIETDSKLTISEKIPFMVEWWTNAHKLLTQCSITRSMISHIVRDAGIVLRDGCDWFFKSLHTHRVPLLILSAGVGDIIEDVICQQYRLYENIKIISNYMDFNGQGILVGFQGDMIHTFNKNASSVQNSDYFHSLAARDSVLLLGDSVGDLRMADGTRDTAVNLLTIGFLNNKVDELLPQYMDLYDIVLVQDETMAIPNAILHRVL